MGQNVTIGQIQILTPDSSFDRVLDQRIRGPHFQILVWLVIISLILYIWQLTMGLGILWWVRERLSPVLCPIGVGDSFLGEEQCDRVSFYINGNSTSSGQWVNSLSRSVVLDVHARRHRFKSQQRQFCLCYNNFIDSLNFKMNKLLTENIG